DDLAMAQRTLAALDVPDATATVELRVRDAEGRWRWCEAHVRNLMHEPSVNGLVVNYSDVTERHLDEDVRRPLAASVEPPYDAIARDITEQARSRQALADSETSFRLLFEANPQPMWVYDMKTLYFLEANEAAVRHYGYSRERFLDLQITDIRPGEDIAPLL